MSVKVSVIAPVYKTEKYLEKCLDSLVAQTLDEIEIIVINDGSPDNSQAIIDDFAEKYPDRIVVINQENQGVAAACNTGVARARGEYIGFVGTDDWVREDMYELLYKTAKDTDADCVICNFTAVHEDDGEIEEVDVNPAKRNWPDSIKGFVLDSTHIVFQGNKLLRRTKITDIPFPSIYAEDLATTPVILSYCERIVHTCEYLYFYLVRTDSLSHRRDSKVQEVMVALERCLVDCNPAYREEMEYAVYYNLSRFYVQRKDQIIHVFMFLWKYEDFFIDNSYIQEAISAKRLPDLFTFMNTSYSEAGNNPLRQNLTDFVNETTPLILQLDKLSQETLKELHEMYGVAVQSANENPEEIGPKLLVKLSSRFERIQKMMC